MQYRSFLIVIAAAVLTFAGSIVIAGQATAPVSGKVELEATDGTRTPVAGATIDIYRSDIKGGSPSATTNKRGQFALAGLLIAGEYIFAVSGPNIAPTVYPKIRAGQEGIVITVYPGDGRKFTEAEARQAALTGRDTNAATSEMSAEEKKARAELEAKNKEIEAKNLKIEKTNEILARAVKEGNEAFAAKNYDLAIAKYTEGYEADTGYIGSAPIFLNKRGAVFVNRAVDNYNKAIKSADTTEKLAGLNSVKKDLADAAANFVSSWNMLKTATPEPAQKTAVDNSRTAALAGAKEVLAKAVRTEQIDPSLIDAAKLLVPEIQAVETDPAKKFEGDLMIADMYRILGRSEEAAAAYKKILETSPDNVDALAYAGIVLVDLSWLKENDKALAQEGANYLQKFVSIAPDTHKLKEGAAGYLAILKTQNVIPVKTTPAKKRN